MRVGVLTISDKGAVGERIDTAGPAVAEMIRGIGGEVVATAIVADVESEIADYLRAWADDQALDLVLTAGGTGLAPRDVTPEATLSVADRLVPGFAELMRAKSREKTPLADVSRAVVVTRGHTLIINLPGSERGAVENLEALLPILPHAVDVASGHFGDHPATPEPAVPLVKEVVMRPSAELTELMRRYMGAIAAGDTDALDGMLSKQPAMQLIGTAPEEWWTGPDKARQIFKAQMAEMGGGFPITPGDPQAFMEATAGWGMDQPTLKLPDGTETRFRITMAFLKENGVWRIIQSHVSFGVPNDETFGKDLTT